jgi:enediyne biosynthesis protein E4
LYSVLFLSIVSCEVKKNLKVKLFELLPADKTGIDFINQLEYSREFNIYTYRNFYNGGGVATGDVNNDGLIDIYLSANMKPNKLYLNKGSFKFEDVTEKAGVAGKRSWSTGVSMVDINADGWLDIYVCNSGDVKGDNKQNEFFINNGDGTFQDKAEQMGLADRGYSTHASFFDYDRDGDLDVYLLNNSYQAIGSFNLRKNERPIRDPQGGDKLFKNEKGIFKDVSEQAGIYGSVIGFGLGIAISDLDKDGWPDIYISNDFFERDYIYMNNGNGTFREELEKQMKSISVASMGSDVADMDGDGLPEIFVTEMLPKDEARLKTTMTFEDWDKHHYAAENGYYHQFTRNMLHKNNGVFQGKGLTFSEVGRMAGVEATDWSWGVLISDLDNDGFKDLYITNGIHQDILNQDYLAYIANEEVAKMVVDKDGVNFEKLIDIIASNKIPNFCFSGGTEFSFSDVTNQWGLATPSHSNGSAYADLDNDGDLDLVVNNVNMPMFLYRNNNEIVNPQNSFLKLILKGSRSNTLCVGAKITLKAKGKLFYQEQSLNRGFQSSVDPRLNFGLGNISIIDTIKIEWSYGAATILTHVKANQTLTITEPDTIIDNTLPSTKQIVKEMLFQEWRDTTSINYAHSENSYNDFNHNRLLFHMVSTEGPKITAADVNADGLEDFFIGGALNSGGGLFIQQKNGKFTRSNQAVFEKEKISEDMGCLFFDADGDHDMDLYVTSGSCELPIGSFGLVDRLYINNGRGNFTNSNQVLPTGNPESTSVVKASDFDGDGDLDLFVGGRLRSDAYGVPVNSYLLLNDGEGKFTSLQNETGDKLKNLGMVTDALWSDFDKDGDEDLIVVGEWMSIRFFENKSGKLDEIGDKIGFANTNGWWNTINTADFNQDGYPDFVVGNLGLNSRFRASKEKPVTCYINDFDQNGSVEQILSQYNGDKSYPMALRHNLIMQLPFLKKKYLKYEDYKLQTVQDIFLPEALKAAVVLTATTFESVVLLSNGKKGFQVKALPREAQLTPTYSFLPHDFDGDGLTDLILGGNLYAVKPEVGRYDASQGLFLKGNGDGSFKSLRANESGIFLEGEIRDMKRIKISGKNCILVARNNDRLVVLEEM